MDSFKSFVKEEKPGLYANIHAKRARIKAGSGEKMRKPGTEGAPTPQDWKDAAKTAKEEVEIKEAKDINFHRAELKKTNDKIEAITKQGGRVGLNDPLTAKLKYHAAQIKKLKEAYEVSESGGYSPSKHPQSKDYGRGEDEEDERDDEDDDEPPFKPDAKKKMALAGKKGYGPSAAKHLAKTGMKANEEVELEEAKAMSKMSDDELKQKHSDLNKKINAMGGVSANHKLAQQKRIIRTVLAMRKASGKNINNEEVEQVDELKKSTLGSYIKKSQTDKSFYAADMGRMASAGDTASSSYDNVRRKHKTRGVGINRAVDRLTKEETELEEAVSVKKQSYSWGKMVTVHHGKDTSYPLHPEHQAKIKSLGDGESTSFNDETNRKVTAKREGDTIHLSARDTNKTTPVSRSHFAEEVEQIDELKASTLNSYIAKRQGNTANRMAHAMRKLGGKPSKHDVYNTGLKRAQQKIDDKRKKETGMNPAKPRPAAAPAYPLGGRDPASGRSYSESTEIEEGVGGTIAGGVGQFIGNKIDPLHGEILRTHGEMVGRAAEYTIRKHVNKLHKALKSILSSGKATNEEVEQVDELSKSTLASYAKKASHDARIKMATGKDFERISITSKKPAYKASAKDWENRYKSDARRREAGVNKAIDRLAKEEVEMDEMIRDVPLAKKVEQEYSDKLMKDFLAKGGQIKQGKPQKAPKNTLRFIARGSLASGERTITKTGSKSFTKRMGEEVEGVVEAKSSRYKIKAIGTDKRGDYYVHPTTGEKIYTAASKYPWEAPKRGDHVNPNTGKVTKESNDSVPASKALQKAHDDERKKRGLPDPSYYLKLAAQKKKEIEDLKNEK